MKPLLFKRDNFERARNAMVEEQVIGRGVKDEGVIQAMRLVPRQLFVEEALYAQAYNDSALPIGEKQTISQPYMVAFMTEALGLTGKEKALEIGAGSGYQTAILSMLADKVYSIERIPSIASRARKLLDNLMCPNVIVRVGDGTLGWKEESPFDVILVAAYSPSIPPAYINQLAFGGRLVMPVGTEESQGLIRVTKKPRGAESITDIEKETLAACRFVKLIGQYGCKEKA